MKIYISHSSKYDYLNKLYEPIKKSNLINENTFIFPHEGKISNTKDTISKVDLVIAEVSLPSTGQGIELGWADSNNIPIVCIYEKGREVTPSLKFITDKIIEYTNEDDMIEKIEKYIY